MADFIVFHRNSLYIQEEMQYMIWSHLVKLRLNLGNC